MTRQNALDMLVPLLVAIASVGLGTALAVLPGVVRHVLGPARTFALAAAVALFVVSGGVAVGAQEKSTYIVQMLQSPVVAYDGGIAGLKATKPAQGEKIDPLSAAVTKYVGYLKGAHDTTLAKVGGAEKLYDYVYSYNGVAAKLTESQAALLQKQPDVLAVTPDELVTQDTSSTPSFLGLDAPGGLWAQLGGPTGDKNTAGAGEGIVIGIVDSGIWPESKSFTDRDANGKLIFQQIPGWHGKCTPGEAFNASMCNQKLIGGQHFNASWGGDAAVEAQRPWEFMSVRDYNGHGTHTSSTSGGNYATPTTGPAAAFGPVYVQSEYANATFNRPIGGSQDVDTFYVMGSWMLTGQHKPYKAGNGVFSSANGEGMWELTARYDTIENKDVANLEASSTTLGVNYYFNKNVRLMFNYTKGDNQFTGDKTGQYAVRTQLSF